MPHPEHAVEDLTGAGTDGLGFFTGLAALTRGTGDDHASGAGAGGQRRPGRRG